MYFHLIHFQPAGAVVSVGNSAEVAGAVALPVVAELSKVCGQVTVGVAAG